MTTSAENPKDASGPPPIDPHREHLRRLRAGLTLTAGMIKTAAAAFHDSVELLRRLDGRATAQPDGNTEDRLPHSP